MAKDKTRKIKKVPDEKSPEKTEQAPEAQKKVKAPVAESKTLKELGAMLPLGVPDESGKLVKPFDLLSWTGKMEREVGKVKRKNPTLGGLVPNLLKLFCTQYGGQTLAGIKGDGAKSLLFNQSTIGDILYAYFYLRREEIGKIVYLVVKCPYCGHMMRRYPADLDTLNVLCYPEGTLAADLVDRYVLERPITIGETECKTLVINPVKWTMMTEVTPEESGDGEAFKLRLIQSAVVNVEELGAGAFFLQDSHVDLIHRRDIDQLAVKIHDLNAGPEITIDGKCQRGTCGGDFVQTIDWTYDSFFSVSSPSMRK